MCWTLQSLLIGRLHMKVPTGIPCLHYPSGGFSSSDKPSFFTPIHPTKVWDWSLLLSLVRFSVSLSLSLSPPPPLWLPAEVSWCEGKSRAIYFLANRKANLWELKSKRGQANEKENSQPSKTRKAQNPPPLFLSSSLLALLWGERGCEVLGDDPHTSKQAVHVTRT